MQTALGFVLPHSDTPRNWMICSPSRLSLSMYPFEFSKIFLSVRKKKGGVSSACPDSLRFDLCTLLNSIFVYDSSVAEGCVYLFSSTFRPHSVNLNYLFLGDNDLSCKIKIIRNVVQRSLNLLEFGLLFDCG